jgi:hypothetical protein
MIRQAHTYLAGAVSGSALVGAAVVAFVLLVSLQALKDWPLAGIGGGGESAVSSGQPAQAGTAARGAAAAGAVAGTAAPGGATGRSGQGADGGQIAAAQRGSEPTATTSPLTGSPASPAAGGGADGASAPSAVSSPGAGGGSDGGGSGSSPAKAGGGAPGGGGQSTSGTVTGAVNDTVSGVDQTLGGGLSETGVSKATEEAVNGVAGPESPIGETVDKTVEAVGGLVGGGHR